MEKGFNGRVMIEEIYEDLKVAVSNVMLAKEIDHVKAFKEYGVSRVDLHGLITGRGNKMPLARLFMFAADLGIKVTVNVEEPKSVPVARKPAERTKTKSEPSAGRSKPKDAGADSDFDDEPARKPRKKRT
jgi:hypothetical protein